MKLMILSNKLLGQKLAYPVYNENGVMFIGRGGELTESAIKKMGKMGITTLYIEDNNDEIQLQEAIESSLKLKIIKSIKALFSNIKEKQIVNEDDVINIVKEVIENLNLSENAVLVSNLMPDDDIGRLAVHSFDVAIYSIMVGINERFNIKKLLKLGEAALLHDIGKLFTHTSRHTRLTYDLLKKSVTFSPLIYVAIAQLYEAMDGSGPLGLQGDKISEFAKILSICNEYVKLTYNELAILPHQAVEKLGTKAVSKFDKDIYKSFIESIYCYPNGLPVILNNGISGIVAMQNRHVTMRPVIFVKDEKGYRFINLMESLTLFVEKVDL